MSSGNAFQSSSGDVQITSSSSDLNTGGNNILTSDVATTETGNCRGNAIGGQLSSLGLVLYRHFSLAATNAIVAANGGFGLLHSCQELPPRGADRTERRAAAQAAF